MLIPFFNLLFQDSLFLLFLIFLIYYYIEYYNIKAAHCSSSYKYLLSLIDIVLNYPVLQYCVYLNNFISTGRQLIHNHYVNKMIMCVLKNSGQACLHSHTLSIIHGEMDDTSELYKSDDSLSSQTHTPCCLVN